MAMAHEWRDVFSDEFLGHWQHRLVEEGTLGQDTAAEATRFAHFIREIRNYHKIPKDDYSTLDHRRKKLKAISKKAARLLKEWGLRDGAEQRTINTINTFDLKGNPITMQRSNYAQQGLARTLLTIQRRALRKAAYLKVLKQYYASKSARDVSLFRSIIGQPHATNGDLIGLHSGTRLEQLDPMHRGMEITDKALVFDPNTRLLSSIDDVNERLDVFPQAFADWFNGNSGIPFFLWLENTSVCTGDNKADSGNDVLSKVSYSRLDKKKLQVHPKAQDPMVMVGYIGYAAKIMAGVPGGRKVGVCDTSSYHSQGKADPGWAAFAFSEHYELFLARHEAGQWHHSSFLSGNPVRCAGMIKIIQGKVKGVNNHSGHYRPRPRHLYNFIKYLDKFNVLSDTCEVHLAHPKLQTDVPGFYLWYENPKMRKALTKG
jgi:hypothetical protein